MKLFRKAIFWLHLAVGLAVGVVIALLATTGLLMAFEHPIVARAEHVEGRPPAPGVQPMAVETLLAKADAMTPDAAPTGLTAAADPKVPVAVQIGRDRVLYLDSYTGEKLGTESRLRGFFAFCLQLHRWLALQGDWHDVGGQVTGVATLGFLVLGGSGLWLWMPRRLRWPSFRAVLVPRVTLNGKARDWNWHNALGFWLLIPLMVIATTGTMTGYAWAGGLLYRAVGETPPPPRQGGRGQGNRTATGGNRDRGGPGQGGAAGKRPLVLDNLNALWGRAEDASPGYGTITLRLNGGGVFGGPGDDAAGGTVSFVVTTGDPLVPWTRTGLTYSRETGDLLRTERFADQTRGRQLRLVVVPIHRGEAFGLAGMTVVAVACVTALVLVYTGFALSWRRLARPVLAPAAASAGTPPPGWPGSLSGREA